MKWDWKHIFYRLDRKVYDHGKLCFQSHFNAFKPGVLFPISVEYFYCTYFCFQSILYLHCMFPNYILLTTHEQLKSKTFKVLPPHANLRTNVAFQRIVLNPLDGKMNITTSAMTTTSGHWMTIFRTKTESPWLKSSSSELNITPASFKASLSISSSDFWMVARLIFSSIPTKSSHKPPTQWPTFVSHDCNRWFMRVQSCWNDGMVISCTWLIYKSQDISNLQVLF